MLITSSLRFPSFCNLFSSSMCLVETVATVHLKVRCKMEKGDCAAFTSIKDLNFSFIQHLFLRRLSKKMWIMSRFITFFCSRCCETVLSCATLFLKIIMISLQFCLSMGLPLPWNLVPKMWSRTSLTVLAALEKKVCYLFPTKVFRQCNMMFSFPPPPFFLNFQLHVIIFSL